jgi:hypothetical protein
MANPTDTRTLADLAATTVDAYLPGLIDNFFNSNPVWLRLASKERVLLDGGDFIRQSMIYDKMIGGSYSGGDTLDIQRAPTKTVMQFDWAQYYVNLTVDGRTMLKNEGGATKLMDLVEAEMETARLSLAEYLGTDLFLDGTGNNSKNILGLIAAIDDGSNVASYGGITRQNNGNQGTAVRAILNTTGGALNLPLINTIMGQATIQPARPDMLITTQTLWDKFWDRVQPQQRFPSGPSFDDLAKIGYNAINFNGAAVVVDSHCASGNVWFLNTDYIKLIIHKSRDFHFTGFQKPSNQDVLVGQIFWMGQFVVVAPRLQARAVSLT